MRAQGVPQLDTCVMLGSGLGRIAQELCSDALRIPYAAIPGMPLARIGGHSGELHIDVACKRAVALGRVHLYQGLSAHEVVFPIRLAAALGVRRLIVTNAAGSLREAVTPGSLVLISDHLNLTGATPLDFSNPLTPEPDFVSMVDAYSPQLRATALLAARKLNITLHEGVYAGVSGPAYETPAEAAMLAGFGASVVGMSTVLEVIAARALGIEVCGISLATNYAGTHGSHSEVLEAAAQGTAALAKLVTALIA